MAAVIPFYVWIFVGGGLGSTARYALGGWVASAFGETFPWGTMFINVTGSFIIGFFAMLTGPEGKYLASPLIRQFFMIGVCGGYTTFSSFSLQTLNLADNGDYARAGANVILSVSLCLVAVWLGHAAAAAINLSKGA